MKKNIHNTIGLGIIVIGILLLSADRLFVSANSGSYFYSFSFMTTMAILTILLGALWVFRSYVHNK